jgi:hypothetical protein
MSDYRFYILRSDSSIEAVRDHDLDDDVAAIVQARNLAEGKPVEVWSGTRLVFRIAADGSLAA